MVSFAVARPILGALICYVALRLGRYDARRQYAHPHVLRAQLRTKMLAKLVNISFRRRIDREVGRQISPAIDEVLIRSAEPRFAEAIS